MTQPQTLAFAFGRSRTQSLATQAGWILAASWAVALAAQIKIALPFTPVPLTLQSFVVILVAAALGRTRGTLAVGAYLLQGLVGLPFFQGANAGLAYAMGPTGGYLLGFLAAAWMVGTLAERQWDRKAMPAWVLFTFAHTVIFALGVSWLARYVGGWSQALALGWAPFIPGEILKSAAAAALLPGLWRLTR